MNLQQCVRTVHIEGAEEVLLCSTCDELYADEEMMQNIDSEIPDYYCKPCAKLLIKHNSGYNNGK